MEYFDQLKDKLFVTPTTSHIPRGPFLGRLELLKEAAKCGLDRSPGVDLGMWVHGNLTTCNVWSTCVWNTCV